MPLMLNPPPALLCKLASIAVHADEFTSPDGHQFDLDALKSALADPDVVEGRRIPWYNEPPYSEDDFQGERRWQVM